MDNAIATETKTTWADLMIQALTKPGLIEQSFKAFHRYSMGNRLYALIQCMERGITPGPLDTLRRWNEKGRRVRKGEKALRLVMPIEVGKSCACAKCKPEAATEKECRRAVIFTEKARWFVLSQTDGEAVVNDAPETWSKERALAGLKITEGVYEHTNGNVQGYASGRVVRVSPLAQNPTATLFHELAHVVLGHTEHTDDVSKDIGEAEAETVALILCETLNVPGAVYCRGYIQSWLRPESVERFKLSANRIFRAADAILNAGLATSAAVADVEGTNEAVAESGAPELQRAA